LGACYYDLQRFEYGASFIVIDIVNAVNSWRTTGAYEIPGTHVALFGMMLAHQLSLLGIYKALENQEIKKKILNNEPEAPKDQPTDTPPEQP
jgi:hypothetical protein